MEPLTQLPQKATADIELPSPTAWPIVLAFGITLVFAGMLTTGIVSVLGAILAVSGYVGWFRDVLPHEKSDVFQVVEEPVPVVTSHPEVARVEWITHAEHRARVPIEIYPVSAGVKGGLAGCVAMAALAMLYGLIALHSIWYPINLLSVGFFPGAENNPALVAAFHPNYLAIAAVIHVVTSLLVGLLYGAMLPMFPRRPVLLGGVIAPVLWSGVIHSLLEFLNPTLSNLVNWPWFVVSQVGFGVVAGIVVSRQQRVHTWQHLPFAIRAGIETSGVTGERNEEDSR